MKIKPGDKVKLLNEVGGGIVKSFIDKNTVVILNEDDFEVPILIADLVVIEAAPVITEEKPSVEDISYNYSDRDEADYFEQDNSKISKQIKLLFGFEKQKESVNAYLINDSDYWLLYNVLVKYQDNTVGLLAGKLEDNTKLYLTNYETEEIAKIRAFGLQLIFYRAGNYEPVKPIEKELEIKPIKFFKEESFIENDYFDNAALLFTLVDTLSENLSRELSNKEVSAIILQKEESETFQKALSHKYKAKTEEYLREVDLHINEILEFPGGLGNSEMLEVQINQFRTDLEKAIKDRVFRIVFIHGVGNGVLKQEIRQIIQKEYNMYSFQDASFKEYGFGATMVIIRK